MNDIERISKLGFIRRGVGVKINQGKLNDRRGIDYSTVTLTEPTCSGGERLLANRELVAACAVHNLSINCPAMILDGLRVRFRYVRSRHSSCLV